MKVIGLHLLIALLLVPAQADAAGRAVDGTDEPEGRRRPSSSRDVVAFADVMSVKDFGAAGDGMTDDTAAIQAAINAARTGTKSVAFAAGTFIVRNIELFAGTVLQGAGRDATLLKLKPGITPSEFLTDFSGHVFDGTAMLYNSYPAGGYNENRPLDGIAIRDLTVDGNYAAQSPTHNGWGIYLNGVTRALIENVTVRNCLNHGITLKESVRGVVRGVKVLSNGNNTRGGGGDGLVLQSQCYDNIVTDSEAIGNKSIGFEDEGRFGAYASARRNKRNRWVKLRSEANGDHNFLALFSDHATWQDLTSVAGKTNGFNIVGTTFTTIDGVQIFGPAKHGIWVRPELFGTVGRSSNLTVRNAMVIGPGQTAIRIEDLEGGSIQARVRGVIGADAVSVITTRSSEVDLSIGCER